MDIATAKVSEIVEQLSWNYAKRCWWADVTDLMQEGWLCAMEVIRAGYELDPDLATGYIHRAVAMRLSRYLWEESSPVSSGRADKELAGLYRAEIPHDLSSGRSPEVEYIEREAAEIIKRLQLRLRKRVEKLLQGAVHIDAVIMVLLEGVKPAEVARTKGVPIEELYTETYWYKSVVVNDRLVRSILTKLEENRGIVCN